MTNSRFRGALLLGLAVPTIATGAWALLAPHGWYESFPGLGRDWLPPLGPYNEHLARDFGAALLALGALLAWSAVAPAVPLRRAAPACFLLFAVPHLAFHLAHTGELPAGDDAVNLAVLTLSVVVPAALLLPTRARRGAAAPGPNGRRLAPAPRRGPVVRLAYAISRRRFGHVLGPLGVTAHSPMLLAGYGAFELALERAGRVDPRLEELGSMRAALMTGCPFCIDFGSARLEELGLGDRLRDLERWRDSDAFSVDERLVLEYAEAMTATPVEVGGELFERLRGRFDEPALVELTAAIALENYRGRFNHAVGLGSEGFCSLRSVTPITPAAPAHR